MSLKKRRISDVIEENYVFTSVVRHLGVDFYDYSEFEFAETCLKKGLKPELIIAEFKNLIDENQEYVKFLMRLPTDIVVSYLKHKHYSFLKQTLPYLAKLIHSYPAHNEPSLMHTIRLNFPRFVENFIRHIQQEENTTLNFILNLNDANKGHQNFSKLFFSLRKHSMQAIVQDHKIKNDLILPIRDIAGDYRLEKHYPVLLNVIYSELRSFENNLNLYSKIKTKVLFPKALLLEKKLYNLLSKQAYLN